MTDLQQRAEHLAAKVFTGGPVEDFEQVGRLSFVTLFEHGLTPQSTFLDVGCGALRVGYWLLHFLDRGRYCGIEPNVEMLQAGIAEILEPGLLEAKQPRFNHNDDFDLDVFGERFDFVFARSIWTHASKEQIGRMLDGFASIASERGVFLASVLPAREGRRRGREDFVGSGWQGRSHQSEKAALVGHKLSWVREQCAARKLLAEALHGRVANNQVWVRITRA